MKEDILISVVIPTYSRNETLVRALNSVFQQTYTNYEIIVVDDNAPGSEWRTRNEELMKQYSDNLKVRYVQNSHNLGGGPTRNHGVAEARGEYIAFLDDDDVYMPERLEKQLNKFLESKNDKLALVYCFAKFINKDGKSTYSDRRAFRGNCIYDAMVQNCIAATSQWMVKKSMLEAVGGFPAVPCKQDSQTILRLLKAGYEVDVVEEELSYYYDIPGARISGASDKNLLGEALYHEECMKLYYLLSKKQIRNVEERFATEFYRIYSFRRDKDNMRKFRRKMFLNNPSAATLYIAKKVYHKMKKRFLNKA